jgi:signal recognition particle subunit SRP54
MFETLTDKLSRIFRSVTGRGFLTPKDVDAALSEVRSALLEADVALEVVDAFCRAIRDKAVGAAVLKAVNPGQMVIKIVHDELKTVLGSDASPLNLQAIPPVPILMVGLQGSGKTTTTAKLAKRLTGHGKRKALMVSLDHQRPAAYEQLLALGESAQLPVLQRVLGETPLATAQRALEEARRGGYDLVLLDTAGRITLDEALMEEVAAIKAHVNPKEVLLVADGLTGQDAVRTARAFDQTVGITGVVLTRLDSDARAGAALSMRAVTGKPIKFVGVGEQIDGLEEFHPSRVADRILDMGDIVALVEKAAQAADLEKTQDMAQRVSRGQFTLDDLREQLVQMERMGGAQKLLGMLPGMAAHKAAISEASHLLGAKQMTAQKAIIDSMTPKERRNADLIKASRKRRIAAGSGTSVEDINRLLKMHLKMADVVKTLSRGGRGLSGMLGSMFGGGGLSALSKMGNAPNNEGPGPLGNIEGLTDSLSEALKNTPAGKGPASPLDSFFQSSGKQGIGNLQNLLRNFPGKK